MEHPLELATGGGRRTCWQGPSALRKSFSEAEPPPGFSHLRDATPGLHQKWHRRAPGEPRVR
eukprot:9443764-Pyramimonas_sp.AAC.2